MDTRGSTSQQVAEPRPDLTPQQGALDRFLRMLPMISAWDWGILDGVEVCPSAADALMTAYQAAKTTCTYWADWTNPNPDDVVRMVAETLADAGAPAGWAGKRWAEYAALALAARPALCEGTDWSAEQYETLTYTWRKVIGELHPDDPELSPDPEPGEGEDQAVDGDEIDTLVALDVLDDAMVDHHRLADAWARVSGKAREVSGGRSRR